METKPANDNMGACNSGVGVTMIKVIPEELPPYVFACEDALKKVKKEIKEIREHAVANIGIVRAEWFAEQLRRKLAVKDELTRTINKERYL